MKRMYCVLFCLIGQLAISQQDAWVYFNAKPNSQDYLDNPLTMLSQRALDRRITQNIALDFTDIPIYEPYVTDISNSVGIQVMAQSKWLNAVHVIGSQQDINALASLAFVAQIDFADNSLDVGNNRLISLTSTPVSQRTSNSQADFPYGDSANQVQMLNAHLLHEQNYTGSGKIIAVMDAGFPGVDTAQPFQRLFQNNLILGGYNFVDRNDQIYTRNAHGTLVLSDMGGYSENELVGTAPDAAYYLFITEDATSENPVEESYWVEAAERADSLGVDVINTSLGYFLYDNPAYSYSYEDMDGQTSFIARGASIAATRGMVVVVSAGNSGATVNEHISTPADAFDILAVGAVNAEGNYVAFSSTGPSFDGRIKPEVAAKGLGAVVAFPDGSLGTANGTSFASPILAGAIASFWQAVPNLTYSQVIDFVKQSASQFDNPDALLGYGIPDFSIALSAALGNADHVNNPILPFPNPVQNALHFNLESGDSAVLILIYNALGQEILEQDLPPNAIRSIDCSNMPSGIYYYRLQIGPDVKTGKFIKQ